MKKFAVILMMSLLVLGGQALADIRCNADRTDCYYDPNYDRFAGLSKEEKEWVLGGVADDFAREKKDELRRYAQSQGKSVEELIIETHQAVQALKH